MNDVWELRKRLDIIIKLRRMTDSYRFRRRFLCEILQIREKLQKIKKDYISGVIHGNKKEN